eukprot:COSAG03_NODE_429_length_7977_cov_3.949606_14_plen_155_part_00
MSAQRVGAHSKRAVGVQRARSGRAVGVQRACGVARGAVGAEPKTASYNFAAQYCSQSDWEQAFSGEGASEREREREREVMVVFGTEDIEKIKADLRNLQKSGDELPWDAEDAPPGLSWTCPKGETCKCNKGGPRAKVSCKLFRRSRTSTLMRRR